MAVCQNLVPLVNIKIAKKMVLIGIDPSPNLASGSWDWKIFSLRAMMACLWSPVTVAPTQTWRRRQRSDPGNLIILKKNIAIKIVDIVDELIIDISWWIYSTGKKRWTDEDWNWKTFGEPTFSIFLHAGDVWRAEAHRRESGWDFAPDIARHRGRSDAPWMRPEAAGCDA